jgi:chromate transporter
MIKEEIVVNQKWISVAKFNRVLAVYQMLPGPEATEICCYFGMICRGYLGSVVAGLG